jgi:hypothetical protein
MAAIEGILRCWIATNEQDKVCKALHLIEERIFDEERPSNISRELLVLCSEGAIQCGDDETARRSVDLFFKTFPPKNQFLIRAYFSDGWLQGMDALHRKKKKGEELTILMRKALERIKSGLELCVQNKASYGFLVYNGSIRLWQIGRFLLRDGGFEHASSFFHYAAQALTDTALQPDQGDAYVTHRIWRIQFQITTAFSLLLAKKADEASKAAGVALELCQGAQFFHMKPSAIRCSIHINAANAAALGKIKGTDCNSSDLKALYSIQVVRSNGARMEQKNIEAELQEAQKLLGDHPESGLGIELLGELALVAHAREMHELASNAAKLCRSSPNLVARSRAEYVEAMERLVAIGAEELERLTPTVVNARVSALHRLQKTLITSSRGENASVSEEGCILIWNVGKYLLNPNLRKHVYKPFAAASNELERIDSKLHELRAMFHFELAKCDIDDDVLVKAIHNVNKGYALDYAVPDTEELFGTLRPLDRFLEPMKEILDLRTDIYRVPETAEEEARLAVEQSRDSHISSVRLSLLDRAYRVILKAENIEAEKGVQMDNDAVLLSRARLFADMVHLGWNEEECRLPDFVSVVADRLLETVGKWNVDRHKELLVRQAQASYVLAEVEIEKLRSEYGMELWDDLRSHQINELKIQITHTNCQDSAIKNGIEITKLKSLKNCN